MKKTLLMAIVPFLLMVIIAIPCNKVDTMRRAEREKEQKIQDSILAPTKCILDSVTFHSREAAEAFSKTLVGAEIKSSTRTEAKIHRGIKRRGSSLETYSQITREYVDLVKYREKFYEIHLLDSRWVFRKIK